MHKFGHYYLPEGRALTVAIAGYINSSRYTTSGLNPPVPVIDPELFNTPLPVLLTPQMNHLVLAQTMAIALKHRGRSI